MSMYATFRTDAEAEKNGVYLDYGSFRIRVARAGGGNKRFAKVLEAKTKPYRRAIQTETMDHERAQDLLREVYAEAIVLGWETKVAGEWRAGIEAPAGGDLLPVTKENVLATFRALPELFADVQDQSSKIALYRASTQDADAGN